VLGPARIVVRHIEAEQRTAPPVPIDHQPRVGDAVALADRPRPLPDLLVHAAPKRAGGRLAGRGDVLDRARIRGIARRAPDVRESDLNGRRQPVEPFGAAGVLPRVPRPQPGGRMAHRDVAQDRRRFGQHPIAVGQRRHARLGIDAQIFWTVLLVGGQIDADELERHSDLLEGDVRGEGARARRVIKLHDGCSLSIRSPINRSPGRRKDRRRRRW
jgi:hypothetical protein